MQARNVHTNVQEAPCHTIQRQEWEDKESGTQAEDQLPYKAASGTGVLRI